MTELRGQSVRNGAGHRWVVAAMCGVLLALLFGFAGLTRQNAADARQSLSDRFETRAHLTAGFTQDFVRDIAARQRSQAERLLGGSEVTQLEFESVVMSLDLEAAVLLDRNGGLLQVWPSKPELIGRDMTVDYIHLDAAVAGRIGVSEMVPSAARGLPVTAVAVPYNSSTGRRVLSGAFSPSDTPLDAYLDSLVPVAGGAAYLMDRSGNLLDASTSASTNGAEFRDLPVGVTDLQVDSVQVTAAVADVPDTPWRIVLVAPSGGLYAPVDGKQLAPWALWFAAAASGCLAIVLFVRLGRIRALTAASAYTDALTRLPNRRALQEALIKSVALSSRHQVPLAALMIDVDRFKTINDTHGHDAGDLALQAIARALLEVTRESDIAGRWGGEEFLVLLPYTDHFAALTVAERIRDLIARTVRANGSAGPPVTASIGVAVLRQDDASALLHEADAALYAAKTNGRNRVEFWEVPWDESLRKEARTPGGR